MVRIRSMMQVEDLVMDELWSVIGGAVEIKSDGPGYKCCFWGKALYFGFGSGKFEMLIKNPCRDV